MSANGLNVFCNPNTNFFATSAEKKRRVNKVDDGRKRQTYQITVTSHTRRLLCKTSRMRNAQSYVMSGTYPYFNDRVVSLIREMHQAKVQVDFSFKYFSP